MNANEILNADLGTVARWLDQGLRWWLDELAGLLPRSLVVRFRRGPSMDVIPGRDDLRIFRNGRLISPPVPRDTLRPVRLMLSGADVLVREYEAPRLSTADIRRMARLDVDRLTPYSSEAVYADVAVLAREGAAQKVALGVWPREDADKLLAQLREAGLEPKVICVGSPADDDGARFDFRPAIDAAHAPNDRLKAGTILWSVVAVLLLLNGVGLILRDIRGVDAMRDAVAAQSGPMTLVTGLRRQVDGEHQRRAELLNQRQVREPLRTLDAITKVMPLTAWVQRYTWNGKEVRIIGYRKGNDDLLEILRLTPGLANVRNSTEEVPVATPSGQPFDITAEIVPPQAGVTP